MLGADYVIASDRAWFLAAYASIGLTPDSGVSYLLPRVVGHQRAMELLLTGRKLGASDAAQWGLANEVVAHEGFDSRMSALCESVATRLPHVLASTKKLVSRAAARELSGPPGGGVGDDRADGRASGVDGADHTVREP